MLTMTEELLFVLPPIVSLIISGLIVVGLWYWWDSGESGDVVSRQGQIRDRTPAPGLVMYKEKGMADNAAEVLRVLRDPADGTLIVELDGNRYRHLAQISTPEVRRRLLDCARALVEFSRLYESAGPIASPLPGVGARVKEAVQRRFGGLFRESRKGGNSTISEPDIPLPLLPIVDQIEDLLQMRLAQSPPLANRSVHLRQAVDGGIRVTVDGQSFEGIGCVTDDEVRAFVETVIREWEDQQ